MTDTNQEQTTVSEEQTTPSNEPSPYEQLLASITNDEGKPKYSNVEDALVGNQHAQQHIRTLEEDNRKLKEEYQRMEDLFKSMSTQTQQPQESMTMEEQPVATTTESPSSSSLDEEALFLAFKQRMSAESEKEKQERNKQDVLSTFQTRYADKAAEVFKQKASELNVSAEFLTDLAGKSPAAVYKVLGLDVAPSQPASWNNSVNTTSLQQTPDKKAYEGKNPMLSGRSKDAVDLWNSLSKK